MISRTYSSEESASTHEVGARGGFFNFRQVVLNPTPHVVQNPAARSLAPWEQRDQPEADALKEQVMPPSDQPAWLSKRHLLFFLLALVLMHLSQLMAKNDDLRGNWTPPIEPPGSVIVTSLSETSSGQLPVGRAAQAPAPQATPATVVSAVAAPAQPTTPVEASSTEQELRQALQQWSQAWSGQAMTPYLGMYASDFEPPKGLSRSAWEQQRTQRITSKKSIRHDMQNMTLRIDANQATVHFTQIYQDERLQSSDQKTMVWLWRNGKWQITREFTA
jgi:hypothetical protein